MLRSVYAGMRRCSPPRPGPRRRPHRGQELCQESVRVVIKVCHAIQHAPKTASAVATASLGTSSSPSASRGRDWSPVTCVPNLGLICWPPWAATACFARLADLVRSLCSRLVRFPQQGVRTISFRSTPGSVYVRPKFHGLPGSMGLPWQLLIRAGFWWGYGSPYSSNSLNGCRTMRLHG
jgi:hypothetical protein